MQTQVGKAFTAYSASSMAGGMNSMIERIVPALVLRLTIIGLEAARVMPKSLERNAARISKKVHGLSPMVNSMPPLRG